MNRSFDQKHENLVAAISYFLKNVRIFALALSIYFLCCSAAINNVLCSSFHLHCGLSCGNILNSSLSGLDGLKYCSFDRDLKWKASSYYVTSILTTSNHILRLLDDNLKKHSNV